MVKADTKKWKGLSKGKKPSDFNKKQLKIGTDIELEHTNSRRVAKRIAMDHLTEHPDYYKELKKMEKKLDARKGVGLNI